MVFLLLLIWCGNVFFVVWFLVWLMVIGLYLLSIRCI